MHGVRCHHRLHRLHHGLLRCNLTQLLSRLLGHGHAHGGPLLLEVRMRLLLLGLGLEEVLLWLLRLLREHELLLLELRLGLHMLGLESAIRQLHILDLWGSLGLLVHVLLLRLCLHILRLQGAVRLLHILDLLLLLRLCLHILRLEGSIRLLHVLDLLLRSLGLRVHQLLAKLQCRLCLRRLRCRLLHSSCGGISDLRLRVGDLRGCIGHLSGLLWSTIGDLLRLLLHIGVLRGCNSVLSSLHLRRSGIGGTRGSCVLHRLRCRVLHSSRCPILHRADWLAIPLLHILHCGLGHLVGLAGLHRHGHGAGHAVLAKEGMWVQMRTKMRLAQK